MTRLRRIAVRARRVLEETYDVIVELVPYLLVIGGITALTVIAMTHCR